MVQNIWESVALTNHAFSLCIFWFEVKLVWHCLNVDKLVLTSGLITLHSCDVRPCWLLVSNVYWNSGLHFLWHLSVCNVNCFKQWQRCLLYLLYLWSLWSWNLLRDAVCVNAKKSSYIHPRLWSCIHFLFTSEIFCQPMMTTTPMIYGSYNEKFASQDVNCIQSCARPMRT
jgi:hypothetical protein